MTTWSSKPLTALGFALTLGACDTVDPDGTFLAGLTPPEDTALPTVPLTQALMMRGKVTLVPPRGYCIDPQSLSQNFALMARCDNMGTATGGEGTPVGVLSVSLARTGIRTLPSVQDVTTAANVSSPKKIRQSAASLVFKAKGTPPSADLAENHWRSVAQVKNFTMGATLYGPKGGRAASDEGATVLEELIKRTTAKTEAG